MAEKILDLVWGAIMLPAALPMDHPFITWILVGFFIWLFFRFKSIVFLIAAVVWGAALGHDTYHTLTNHGPRFDRLILLLYSPLLWLTALAAGGVLILRIRKSTRTGR